MTEIPLSYEERLVKMRKLTDRELVAAAEAMDDLSPHDGSIVDVLLDRFKWWTCG